MEVKNIINMLPCTDRSIFADNQGFLHERIGVGWLNDGYDSVCYLSEEGYWYDIDNPSEAIIGHVGDTIRARDLSYAFNRMEEGLYIHKEASRYFKIDTSDLNDTVRLYFSICSSKPNKFFLEKCSSYFPRIGGISFDISNDWWEDKEEDDAHGLRDIIWSLVIYSILIGSKVNIEAYINKYANSYQSEKIIEETNEIIIRNEEILLPQIRRKINDLYDEAWHEESNGYPSCKVDKKREEEIREMYLSKYDKDPNLM